MSLKQLAASILFVLILGTTGCRDKTAVIPEDGVTPASSAKHQAAPRERAELHWHRYVPRLLSKTGVFEWQYPIDQRGMTQEAMVAASVVCGPHGVCVPLAGEPGRRGVALLPADLAGFDNPDPTWVHKSPLPVFVAPQTCGTRLAYIDGTPGDEGRRLRVVGADGKLLWDIPVAGSASGAFEFAGERLIVQDEPGELTMYSEGKQTWRTTIGRTDHMPLIWRERAWVAASEPPGLSAVNLADGSRTIAADLEAAPTTAPVTGGDQVILGTKCGVATFGESGLITRNSTGRYPVASDLAVSPEWIAFVTADEKLTVLRREDGAVVCDELPAARSCAPLVFDNAILFVAGESLMTISTSSLSVGGEQPEPTRWADISWLGPPVADAVPSQQHIYLSLTGWGLVRFGALDE